MDNGSWSLSCSPWSSWASVYCNCFLELQQVERSVVEAVLHRLFALLQDGAMEARLKAKQGNVLEKKVAFRPPFKKAGFMIQIDTNYID